MCLLVGCTPPTVSTTAATPTGAEAGAGELTLALSSLRMLAEGNDAQPGQRTIFYLNQWISNDPQAAAAWRPDRTLENLPRALRTTPGLERLDKLQFSLDDADYQRQVPWLDDISYLQQTLWLHDIAERVRRESPAPRLASWLKEIEGSVGIPEAEQLATAERLLDWTTRNLQLDPLPPIPKDPEATAGSTETVLPSARGEVGPGYQQLPLQVLLHGHGDAHERARVFILLCRQAGIDAVMLGFAEEQSATRRGWLPAALIGGKLYLFDTGLGFPVPGPDGLGIATLEQVVKEPQILRQLDVAGLPAYPVTEKDLKQGVLALIDAEPAALSRRMQLLQAAMPANQRLALTIQPSQLDAALRKAKASGVSLWSVPFEAILFRLGQIQAAMNSPQLGQQLYRQNALFARGRPLTKGRNLHLQGRHEFEDQKEGARALYLQCRRPDREIDALQTNDLYRKLTGIEQVLPNDPAQKQAAITFFSDLAREEKFNATYWLGLTYQEAGNAKVAIEWLTRTVQASPPSTWIAGGRYNLARCYEQLGQTDLARQWLESDKESPQRHGNLLRAKLLGKQVSGKPAAASN
jgi:tetratricopeptide (TPR) repeat protein